MKARPPEAAARDRTTRGFAFSLVEVVMALGIFSFAVVGIVYLLGSGLSSSRDSAKDSSIAAALHSIDSSMRTTAPSTFATSGTAATYYFDLFGNLLTTGTASTQAQYAYYKADVVRVDPVSVSGTMGFTNPPFTTALVTDSQSRQFLWRVKFSYPYPNYPLSTTLLMGHASYDSTP